MLRGRANRSLSLSCGSGWRGIGIGATRGKEAGATINWPALRWKKRHRCLLAALGALNRDLDALANSRGLCRSDRGQAFIFRLLAAPTTLRLVLQSFVVKKRLFSGGPDEALSAVNAFDVAIVKLALGLTLGTLGFSFRDFHLFHDDLLASPGTFAMVSFKHAGCHSECSARF